MDCMPDLFAAAELPADCCFAASEGDADGPGSAACAPVAVASAARPGWYAAKTRRKCATRAQRRALRDLFPVLGLRLGYRERLDAGRLSAAFGRSAPRTVLEIGFGTGASLVQQAAADPAADFLGIDWHTPGVGRALRLASEAGATNVRLVAADAAVVLALNASGPLFSDAQIFFPDPWYRDADAERLRVLRPELTRELWAAMLPGGRLWIATDVEAHVTNARRALLGGCGGAWQPAPGTDQGVLRSRPEWRPVTPYERKGIAEGRSVWDLCFTQCPSPAEPGFCTPPRAGAAESIG
eukprot:TRINITY_DN3864_c0_g3_i1.p1 TRINITY_DN3864_c0_g3~~TRINITY_DN3864_c0_g3_i1.p1  ORF type:complete len:297 (+),score=62.31 TRINITY_DN3864_c0_g3_i1:67-957(+)